MIKYIKSEFSNQEIIFIFKNRDLAHWFNLNTLGLFMKTSELLSDKTGENFITSKDKTVCMGKPTKKNNLP